MFPVKHTVIYTFFGSNVSPKHLFLQCFQCSGIQKPCKILLCTMFFSFWSSLHLYFKQPRSHPQPGQGHDFPPRDPSNECFFHFSPPWRLPKLGHFRFSPRGGFPSDGICTFPPWGLLKLRIFTKLGNFHFSPP